MNTMDCPVCREPVAERVAWSPLLRELRMHLLLAHSEELRARLDNPDDSVIAELGKLGFRVNREEL